MERPQFTVRQLLWAVTWFAVSAGLFTGGLRLDKHDSDISMMPLLFAVPAFGAGLGAIFGRSGFGAMFVTGVFFAVLLCSALIRP